MTTTHTPEQKQAFQELKAEIKRLGEIQKAHKDIYHLPHGSEEFKAALEAFTQVNGEVIPYAPQHRRLAYAQSRLYRASLISWYLDLRRQAVGKAPCHGWEDPACTLTPTSKHASWACLFLTTPESKTGEAGNSLQPS